MTDDTELTRVRGENMLAMQLAAAHISEQEKRIAALLAENVALREIVQAVAALPVPSVEWPCQFRTCGGTWHAQERRGEHGPDCPVTKARALLAGDKS